MQLDQHLTQTSSTSSIMDLKGGSVAEWFRVLDLKSGGP